MKNALLAASLILASAPSLATESLSHIVFVYGNGTGYGTCSGTMGNFCLDQVKQSARQSAMQDADRECYYQKGQLQSYTASCIENCNPWQMPYDAPPEPVSCQSRCTVNCEISG